MTKMYWCRFTVAGASQFPLDMLRYDSCFPTDGMSAAEIGNSIDEHYRRGRKSFEVTLTHVGPLKWWEPTVGRWSSFNWGVDMQSITRGEMGE